ncbi:MAG: hypothetical protein DMD75_14875 [Candidatus Rokuibacteriota bacterium]|nr:MAG: hypothetical protein DMD75_14875 [Candidatus Rokubacteria bacterium]
MSENPEHRIVENEADMLLRKGEFQVLENIVAGVTHRRPWPSQVINLISHHYSPYVFAVSSVPLHLSLDPWVYPLKSLFELILDDCDRAHFIQPSLHSNEEVFETGHWRIEI